ncbi:hypothetical protein LUZ60_003297 [Juncus effusus]|nr:hypothetical protein LUZ60_003297 [Juncus effusus]
MARFLSFIFSFLLVGVVSVSFASVPEGEEYWKTVLPDISMPSSIYELLHPTGDSSSETSDVAPSHTHSSYDDPFGRDYSKHNKLSKHDIKTSVYFLEDSLFPGSKNTFVFHPSSSKQTFLPRKTAESIPFSLKDLPTILSRLSINPNSIQAREITRTLRSCEAPTIRNEVKSCATSLESMIEFAMSALETHDVTVRSSNLPKSGLPEQEYTVSDVRELGEVANYMACHEERYPYAVYMCHTMGPSRSYVATMSAKDGTTIDLVSICHLDTSPWNPNHVAFQVLNVKPGDGSVCHIMPYGHIFWGPKKKMFQLDEGF